MTYLTSSRRADRLTSESIALMSQLPQFELRDAFSPDGAYVVGSQHSTTSFHDYRLALMLPNDYPDRMPPLYVISPHPLFTHDGTPVPECSHEYHTLDRGPEGEVQICHSYSDQWDPWISCVGVLMRGLLWIYLYEQPMRTGRTINDVFVELRRRT